MSVLDVVEFVSGLDLEFHVHNRVLVSQHRSVGHRLVSVDAAPVLEKRPTACKSTPHEECS